MGTIFVVPIRSEKGRISIVPGQCEQIGMHGSRQITERYGF